MTEETETKTIFHKVLSKEIPTEAVYEDDFVYAFKDNNPVSPFHVLVVPKKLQGLTSLSKATDEHEQILGKLLVAVSKIAKEYNLDDGFRTVINNGDNAGQSVFYLHVHLIGKKKLGWPPG